MTNKIIFIILMALALYTGVNAQPAISTYNEPHRPQVHFSPKQKWMNDPNGMVYYKGVYHLFYQYYPDSTVWGPMHWGHATSTDLIHWQHLPIALYPDSMGYIFSGSAVIDKNNTSGFGEEGKPPMVALFTHHNSQREKQNSVDVESQSLAYSLDEGKTWIKYAGNPVVKNPGLRDFRDPKVMWYEAGKKWIMTLATTDHITFYSSPNLKDWQKESEIGKGFGAHGGVWECPDLFALKHEGKEVWVLVINLNPGGPNGGSATQYFTGQFNGHVFTPYDTATRWLDYGPDEYAGITWSNTGDRKVFIGWMSNWQYANIVPTKKWRSATTIPRELRIEKIKDEFLVASAPVKELAGINDKLITVKNIAAKNYDVSALVGKLTGPARLSLAADNITDFALTLSNSRGEKVVIGYDKANNNYFIDRTQSGITDFEKGFAAKHTAPRFLAGRQLEMTLIIDHSSIELFADNGLTVMTCIFFPNDLYSNIRLTSPGNFIIKELRYNKLKSIWK